MILCARSTSRSREQSTKRRSCSKSMRKVCLFYSQNNKIVWLANMTENTKCAKVCGLFSWLCFWDADWLGKQTPITWQSMKCYKLFGKVEQALSQETLVMVNLDEINVYFQLFQVGRSFQVLHKNHFQKLKKRSWLLGQVRCNWNFPKIVYKNRLQ